MFSQKHLTCAIVATLLVCAPLSATAINACPGEGDRYGDFKCNHDGTHRVCATVVDNPSNCSPIDWGGSTFWGITGQTSWASDVCNEPNAGNSWCICMWAFASLVNEVGCAGVHMDCGATDVSYVLSQYSDGGTNLESAHACLQQKCGGASQ